MAYVDFNSKTTYRVAETILEYNTGLLPCHMVWGLQYFLIINNHFKTDVSWAPHAFEGKEKQKTLVLDEIETMLEDNLPVVFAYYSLDDEKISMYYSSEAARNKGDHTGINSHYMTIIGLDKYLAPESLSYEYILKVVSWGKIFYIRYDEYSDSLNYFSNILGIS